MTRVSPPIRHGFPAPIAFPTSVGVWPHRGSTPRGQQGHPPSSPTPLLRLPKGFRRGQDRRRIGAGLTRTISHGLPTVGLTPLRRRRLLWCGRRYRSSPTTPAPAAVFPSWCRPRFARHVTVPTNVGTPRWVPDRCALSRASRRRPPSAGRSRPVYDRTYAGRGSRARCAHPTPTDG
jgi:hypothetical protein